MNYEFRIDRVTLVTTEKLARRRLRLGLPLRLSEMRKQTHKVFESFFDEASVMAILRVTGTVNSLEREVVTLIRDELAILTASQLGYVKRSFASAPAISDEHPVTRQSLLWLGSRKNWTQPNRCYGPLGSLCLDANWLKYQNSALFLKLLRLIQGEIEVAKAWRLDLRRAAILIGLSHAANCLPDAFLWNMIALELLMTRQGDTVGDALPSRAEALLGWSQNWQQDGFENKIRTVYERRCRLVHQGDRECPTSEDLYFTDDLLLCLLANLVAHPSLFSSKDTVIEFSKRVKAEKLLGVEAEVRPKSLRMFRRHYHPKDYDIY